MKNSNNHFTPLPWWKRVTDILLSTVALFGALPIMLATALFIKFTDKGNILLKQKRLGLNGNEFYIYKFRTMYENNKKILEEYFKMHPEAKKEWEIYRKLRGYDPRVTPIGKILRKYSIDELPQLFNVLKGDMSLVGPRPYLPEELDNVPPKIRQKILSVRPGITGLWQISGRNRLTFKERLSLDLNYVESLSFKNDLKILIKTLFIVLKGKGAY